MRAEFGEFSIVTLKARNIEKMMADDGMSALLSRPNGEQTVVNIVEMFANNDHNKLKSKNK